MGESPNEMCLLFEFFVVALNEHPPAAWDKFKTLLTQPLLIESSMRRMEELVLPSFQQISL